MQKNPAKLKVSIDNFHDAVLAIQRVGSGKKIGHNTTIEEVADSETGERGIGVKLYRTVVVAYFPDRIVLNSGGHETVTTKARMNAVLPPSVRVFQQGRKWFVHITRTALGRSDFAFPTIKVPFYDGIAISVDPTTYLPNPMVRPTRKGMGSFAGHDLGEAQAVWARGMSKSAPLDPRQEYLDELARERAGNVVDVRGDYERVTRAPVSESSLFRRSRAELEAAIARGDVSIRDALVGPGQEAWMSAIYGGGEGSWGRGGLRGVRGRKRGRMRSNPPELQGRDQLYNDVFHAAIEGGVNYWADIQKYKWQNLGNEYFAVLVEGSGDDLTPMRVDRKVIAKGWNLLRDGKVQVREDVVRTIREADRELDASEIDADIADLIVQVGLFNEIVFG